MMWTKAEIHRLIEGGRKMEKVLKGEPVKGVVKVFCPICDTGNIVIYIKYHPAKKHKVECWNCKELFEIEK